MKRLILFILLLLPVFSYGQIITTYAGGGTAGDGSPATSAKLGLTCSGSFDFFGNYYFWQDGAGPRIRKINTSGIISTVAGTGIKGYSGDGGPATAADIQLGWTTVDSIGNIYLSDNNICRIRKIDAVTGIISTIAGNGTPTTSGDGGPATAATIVPFGICFDKHWKNLYVCANGYIRKIDMATGIISYVAGDGLGGFSGDGAAATAAGISTGNICIDESGNLYIGGATRIRKISAVTGIITSVGGNGAAAYSGDEIPATAAQFKEFGIAVDTKNYLFIADMPNQRVRVIDPSGIIHTITGTGTSGYSGDVGPSTAAQISNPEGLALDVCGNLYIADDNNLRIRKITFPTPVLITPTISISAITSASVGTIVTVTAAVSNAGSSYIIHWLNKGVEFTTTTSPSVTYTKGTGIDTITARVVSTTTYGCYDSTTSAKHIVSVSSAGILLPYSKGELIVYPNPTTDLLHINTANGTYQMLTITNSVGQVMLQRNITAAETAVPVSKLPAGMYYISLRGSAGVAVTKFVKE